MRSFGLSLFGRTHAVGSGDTDPQTSLLQENGDDLLQESGDLILLDG
jgi:hypothetical protein